MKRYLAFSGDIYYPSQGMGDFIGDYDDIKDAIFDVKTSCESSDYMWGLVYDTIERKDVFYTIN